MCSILLVCFIKDGVCVSTKTFNIDADPVQEILLDPPTECDSIQICLQRLDVPPPSTPRNQKWENLAGPCYNAKSCH